MYGFLGFSRTIQALIVLIFFYSIFPFLSFIQVHAFMRSTQITPDFIWMNLDRRPWQ